MCPLRLKPAGDAPDVCERHVLENVDVHRTGLRAVIITLVSHGPIHEESFRVSWDPQAASAWRCEHGVKEGKNGYCDADDAD